MKSKKKQAKKKEVLKNRTHLVKPKPNEAIYNYPSPKSMFQVIFMMKTSHVDYELIFCKHSIIFKLLFLRKIHELMIKQKVIEDGSRGTINHHPTVTGEVGGHSRQEGRI